VQCPTTIDARESSGNEGEAKGTAVH
jgi:hypothetical protein